MFDAVAHTGAVLQVERDAPFVPLPDGQAAPPYPGHIIQLDSDGTESVKLIQQRLHDLGFMQAGEDGPKPLVVDGEFIPPML